MKAEAADAEQQRRTMAEQVTSAAAEVAAVTIKAQEAVATAQAQAAANDELMLRKTSIEWQLIQALSSSKSPKVQYPHYSQKRYLPHAGHLIIGLDVVGRGSYRLSVLYLLALGPK